MLLILLLCNLAFADLIDWESEEMLGNVTKGELGMIDDVSIKYQQVDRPSQGHMMTGLKLQWIHPSKKDCCVADLVEQMTDGIESLKLEKDLLHLVYLIDDDNRKANDVKFKKISQCWKLNKDKTEFTQLKSCPKNLATKPK